MIHLVLGFGLGMRFDSIRKKGLQCNFRGVGGAFCWSKVALEAVRSYQENVQVVAFQIYTYGFQEEFRKTKELE